jgi:hypothetical protein
MKTFEKHKSVRQATVSQAPAQKPVSLGLLLLSRRPKPLVSWSLASALRRSPLLASVP